MTQVLGKSGVSTGCVDDRRRWEELGRWKVILETMWDGVRVSERTAPTWDGTFSLSGLVGCCNDLFYFFLKLLFQFFQFEDGKWQRGWGAEVFLAMALTEHSLVHKILGWIYHSLCSLCLRCRSSLRYDAQLLVCIKQNLIMYDGSNPPKSRSTAQCKKIFLPPMSFSKMCIMNINI